MQPNIPITLFENEEKPYSELGWDNNDARIELLEKLNNKCGTTLLRLGCHNLKATQYVGIIRIECVYLKSGKWIPYYRLFVILMFCQVLSTALAICQCLFLFFPQKSHC